MSFQVERRELLIRRQRGIILKIIRENHEFQDHKYDGAEIWGMMLKIGQTLGKNQIATLLQDLQEMDYIDFKQTMDEETGAVRISEIKLTAAGLRFYTRHKSNDDVEFN